MSTDYNPNTIEREAQQFWDENRSFNIDTNKIPAQKFYGLCAFPYPSGDLHVGHMRNYVLGDVIARYQRMQGKQTLYPTGWDAFGLPAENAAIQKGVDPAIWTDANIERMRGQLKRLGLSYDWDRELKTCDPNYYKWEQWFFIKLFEKGLAYRKTSWVNWDPVDQTILANEQVIQGRGWRSNALVERKAIPQWFLKITDYAEELLKDLDALKGWSEPVKTMQRHWIGRSEGVIVQFKLTEPEASNLEVFTTRVDTLMGVSYIAISPEHPLAQKAAQKDSAVKALIEKCLNISTAEEDLATQEKIGAFTGFYAEHPILKTRLPIWIANFVEMGYGTGAVMAVPAHDTRDFDFAMQYQLPILPVIAPSNEPIPDYTKAAYTKDGVLINSGIFTGLNKEEATQKITEYLKTHQLGYPKTQYRLKDWGVSRQRYWGAPIPIIYCDKCGTLPVPLEDLPVKLPKMASYAAGEAPPPLSKIPEFYKTTCPHCQGPAQRETDTFDTFFESSWYFIRFLCPDAAQMITQEAQSWLPVDHYILGIEHAILHLLYSRFFYRLFHTLGLLNTPSGELKEPFKEVLTLGMVLKDGAKMSKSKGNVVNPNTLIEEYGADALRLFILFAAPPTQSLEWSDEGLLGASRFLKRLWHFVENHNTWLPTLQPESAVTFTTAQKNVRTEIHTLLQSALQDYERYQFNTVIATCMKLFNTLQSAASELVDDKTPEAQNGIRLMQEGISILLRLLAPIVPHITHTLWLKLKNPHIILDAPWPLLDQTALYKEEVTLVIQINGKRRAAIQVASDTSSDQLKEIALEAEVVKPYLAKVAIKKMILPPRKANAPLLINLVTTS